MKLKKEKNIKRTIKKYKKNIKKKYYYRARLRLQILKYETSLEFKYKRRKSAIRTKLKRTELLKKIFKRPISNLELFKLFNHFKFRNLKKIRIFFSSFFKSYSITEKFKKEKLIIISQLLLNIKKFKPLFFIALQENKKALNFFIYKTSIMIKLKKGKKKSIYNTLDIKRANEREENLKKITNNIKSLKNKVLKINLKRNKLEKRLKKLGYNINSYNSFLNFFPMVKKETIKKETLENLKNKFINYQKT